MFRCESCVERQNERTPPIMVVTQVYVHDYNKTNRYGYDTSEEIRCCTTCAVTLTHLAPEILRGRGFALRKEVRAMLVQQGLCKPDPDELSDIAKALAKARGVSLGELATFSEAVT